MVESQSRDMPESKEAYWVYAPDGTTGEEILTGAKALRDLYCMEEMYARGVARTVLQAIRRPDLLAELLERNGVRL